MNREYYNQRDLTFQEKVAFERIEQDKKWGVQNHHPFVWIAILAEEFGEFAQAALELSYHNRENNPNMEKELVQIAAVAQAIHECGKRNEWEFR